MVGTAPVPRTLDLDGGPLSVDVQGTGRPLLLLHGAPGTPGDFDELVSALEGTWSVVSVALPGFGRTPRSSATDPSPESIASVVCDAITLLGLDDCVVLGHSFGAAVAGTVAARAAGRVSALALVAPVGLRPHRAYRWSAPRLSTQLLATPGIGGLLRALLPGFFRASGFASPPPVSVLERTVQTMGHFDWAVHRERVASLDLPTLVAWADDDPPVRGRGLRGAQRRRARGPSGAVRDGGALPAADPRPAARAGARGLHGTIAVSSSGSSAASAASVAGPLRGRSPGPASGAARHRPPPTRSPRGPSPSAARSRASSPRRPARR